MNETKPQTMSLKKSSLNGKKSKQEYLYSLKNKFKFFI